MSELEKLINKWEVEKGSYMPNASIYEEFIKDVKEALEREEKKKSKRITDFKIKVGDKLDYVEYGTDIRMPIIVKEITFDGFVFLITFLHENDTALGSTMYPDKLKNRL